MGGISTSTRLLDRIAGEKELFSEPLHNCSFCGKFHSETEHHKYMVDMPQEPVTLIDDLLRMGLYKTEVLSIADTLTGAELRKALFLRMVSQGDPYRQQLCNELIKQAGGLDEAFAAAFGHRSAEFFSDTIRNSQFTRRDFLRKVAIGAALVTMASCVHQGKPTQTSIPSSAATNVEKTELKVGFIPITCATPIIMAELLGFYKKYGLNVKLVKMPSWAAVRDSAIAGELDAYHMLTPMPISMSLGLGSTAFPVRLASIENSNGQGIAVANKHKGKVKGPADFKGFKIGIPFSYSMHNLLLRYYLAAGGLNPNKDVELQLLSPPESVAKMIVGQLDAFLMPDNFVQRAVYEGVGFIHILTKDIWPGHPCCAFAASQEWIDRHPQTFQALNTAIIDAASYANNPANRKGIARAIASRNYLNQPVPVLESVLTGKFEDGQGNLLDIPDRITFDPYPWKSFASWIVTQLVRWDYMPEEKANYQEIGNQIFLTDLAQNFAKELGLNLPTKPTQFETLKFDTLDPNHPVEYLKEQVKKYGSPKVIG